MFTVFALKAFNLAATTTDINGGCRYFKVIKLYAKQERGFQATN